MTGGTDLTAAEPFVLTEGADETDGEYVRFEATLHPVEAAAPDLPHERWGLGNDFEHVHPDQAERFEVLSGELRVELDGDGRTLNEGEAVTLPEGVAHRHYNPTDGPVRVAWERRPAYRTEAWAETLYALAQAGAAGDDGLPNLLQTAVILEEYPRETPLPSVAPPGLQKAALSMLAAVGRALGYEATHTRGELGVER